MNNLSRTKVRRWTTLLALLFIVAAGLITALATIEPDLLNPLHHRRDDVFLVTGFLIAAILSGSLLFPMYLEPKEDNTDDYEPEVTPELPYAGTDIEPLAKHPLVGYHSSADERDAILDRLRNATIIMIHRQTGISTDDASTRVRRGEWTENTTAAWFLGETPAPRSARFYARISDSLAFRHGARETISEIVTYEQRHNDTEANAP
ncbi:hypothetical protein ELS19_10205 [Halogeometricum borinquense]|uniref:Uncharacterized protein n=1 Tax=Halogeometricum borinquense TaxID=60847 RepID=A0A482TDB6_9EURY|nr:hypothetical protein [Halogeometricum borinquense]RYJ14296.1 hypothetical protein ELS19_10205 [Halogeometricum borinquense]